MIGILISIAAILWLMALITIGLGVSNEEAIGKPLLITAGVYVFVGVVVAVGWLCYAERVSVEKHREEEKERSIMQILKVEGQPMTNTWYKVFTEKECVILKVMERY